MKKILYTISSLVLGMMVISCSDIDVPVQDKNEQEYTTLVFEPEDEMDVEVKSEIGPDKNIWCLLYNTETQNTFGPILQSEIVSYTDWNQNTKYKYTYNIPKEDNLLAYFAILPEGKTMNDYKWEVKQLTYDGTETYFWNFTDSWAETGYKEIWMSSFKYGYGSYPLSLTNWNSEGNVSGSTTLYSATRQTKIKFKFNYFPETIKAEDVVKGIYLNFGSVKMEMIPFDELINEADTEYKYVEATLHLSQEERAAGSPDFNYIIETNDGKLYSSNKIILNNNSYYYYYSITADISYNDLTK